METNGRVSTLQMVKMVFTTKTKQKHNLKKPKLNFKKDGVQFPIHIDVPVAQNSTNFCFTDAISETNSEETLGKDNVVLDLQMMDQGRSVEYYFECHQLQMQIGIFKDWLVGTRLWWSINLPWYSSTIFWGPNKVYLGLQVVWITHQQSCRFGWVCKTSWRC